VDVFPGTLPSLVPVRAFISGWKPPASAATGVMLYGAQRGTTVARPGNTIPPGFAGPALRIFRRRNPTGPEADAATQQLPFTHY